MNMKLALIGLGAASLSACVSVLPEPVAPDALYKIEAQTKLTGLTHDIIVREPEAPRLIAGQGIVSEGADGGLRMIPSAEWSGPATRQIQLAMIDSFATGTEGNAVLPELGIFADYELASKLSVFRLQGETAMCEMVVSLIATEDRSLVARADITSETRADSGKAKDRALALKEAASDCATQASQFAIDKLPDGS